MVGLSRWTWAATSPYFSQMCHLGSSEGELDYSLPLGEEMGGHHICSGLGSWTTEEQREKANEAQAANCAASGPGAVSQAAQTSPGGR